MPESEIVIRMATKRPESVKLEESSPADKHPTSSPQKIQDTQWDLVSCFPYPHLNFIFNTMMPAVFIEDPEIQMRLETFRQFIESIFEGEFGCEVLVTGSSYQGLSVPAFIPAPNKPCLIPDDGTSQIIDSGIGHMTKADIDFMYKMKTKQVGYESDLSSGQNGKIDFVIETDYVHAGYMRLRLLPGNTTTHSDYRTPKPDTDDEFYLNGTAMVTEFVDGVCEKMKNISEVSDLGFSRQGPSLCLDIKGKPSLSASCDSDNVLALPCSRWPLEAQEWGKRFRRFGWPAKELVKDIMSDGCMVVPVAHSQSTLKDAEWRYSFSVAEMKLCQTMTSTHKQCYILVRILQRHVLSPPKILSSYHLKTVFFWLCEGTPQSSWVPENLAVCVFALMDKLLEFLVDGNLPHYFLPQNNIISHVSEDFRHHLIKKLILIRRNPVKHLLSFDKLFKFSFSPLILGWDYVLKPVLDDIEMGNVSLEQLNLSKVTVYTYLMRAELETQNYDWLVKLAEQECKDMKELGINWTQITCLTFHAMQLPVDKAIHFLEYLTKRFKNNDNVASVFCNLACKYYSKLGEAKGESRSTDWHNKAKETFTEAVSRSDCTTATKMEFANFLFHTNHQKESISVLQDIINEEKDFPENVNSYGIDDVSTVDINLKRQILAKPNNNVDIPSLIYAYYLLVQYNINSANSHSNNHASLLKEFQSVCDVIVDNSKFSEVIQSLCFLMLGYTYMMAEQCEEALMAFGRALELDTSSPLAVENITNVMYSMGEPENVANEKQDVEEPDKTVESIF